MVSVSPTSPTMLMQLVVLLVSSLLPTVVQACGGFFCQPNAPVLQRGEAIAFFMENDSVTMHVQILYEGPAEGFSWVLPVPATPELSIGTDALFRGLFDSTLPTFELEVINELSETCTLDEVTPFMCPFFNQMADAPNAMRGDDEEVEVIEEGSVGPFDFVILEAADNNPTGVFDWLQENGYDQPQEAAALLNYYALADHKFVALRLRSNTEVGEIEPIVLTYQMPDSDTPATFEDNTQVQVARRALACVPIQLTRIAATDNMPIQVYVFGPARAVPLNYLEVQLDDTKVDWVGCFNNDVCYDDNYRQRFAQVTNQITNHTFITEYAGPTSILDNQIAIELTVAELEDAQDPADFLQRLADANVPDTRRLLAIIDEYLPYDLPEDAPVFCQQFTSFYQGPSNGFGIPTQQCLWNYKADDSDWTFDALGLALALDQDVFEPSREAQRTVSQYPYLTRLYTRLSPTNMNKDPFFTFKPDLPTVSHQHRATAVPECRNDGTPIALDVTVQGQVNSFRVMATLGCNGWIPTDGPIVVDPTNNVSFAEFVASWGFPEDEGVVVLRSADGSFDPQAVQIAIEFGDSLVMDQTIPEYVNGTGSDEDDDMVTASPTNETSGLVWGEFPITIENDTAVSELDTAVSKSESDKEPWIEVDDGEDEEEAADIEERGPVEPEEELAQDDASSGGSTNTQEVDDEARDAPVLESSAVSLRAIARVLPAAFGLVVVGLLSGTDL